MRRCLLLSFLAIQSLTASGAQKIPGQKPLVIIGDKFQYVAGSWATYQIRDKTKNEQYRMYIAVLEKDKKKSRRRHGWRSASKAKAILGL